MSLFDHPLISERYFFPRQDRPKNCTTVEFEQGTLQCYHRINHPQWPTVIFFHGNGECIADYVPHFVETLSTFNVNVFLAEYRGYGGSDGTPKLTSMLRDVHAIHSYLNVSSDSCILFGRSVGSIYAIEYVHQYPKSKALIIESGIASPLERIALRVRPWEINATWKDFQQEALSYFNHEQKLKGYTQPVLILHTRNDHIVDVSHAQRLAQWSPKAHLHLFEKGHHNNIYFINASVYDRTVKEFITSLKDS